MAVKYLPGVFAPICPRFSFASFSWIVDKFHFATHNEEFCNVNCNPYKFDEVFATEGFEDPFNTQAAEQHLPGKDCTHSPQY